MKALTVPLLVALLGGCVGNIVVRMPPPGGGETAGEPSLAEVQVNDLRIPGVAASTREAAFGVPMGNVSFDPPEAQLIKQTLEFELTKRLREKGVVEKRAYSCDLTEFGINTLATAVYWDVVSRVRLVLKRNGKEYPISVTSTERTYIWPGETLIRKTVEEALKQVAGGVTPAVAD